LKEGRRCICEVVNSFHMALVMGTVRHIFLILIILQIFYVTSANCQSADYESESESGSGEDEEEDVSEEVFKQDNEKITFTDIITLAVSHMVNASAAKEKGELLNRYFFTVKKEDSIWPKALKETENTTNVEFQERELADMENAIKNIYRRILECNLNNAGQKKKKNKARDLVKCYMTLGEFIKDGFIDFGFPRGTMRGQTHMFEMNMAYNVMVLLIYHMLSGMEEAAMNMNSFETQLEFYRIAEAFVNAVETTSKNSIEVRIESITPIEICNIQEALWTEFPVQCSTRAKRDLSNVQGIGGTSDLFRQKYRATVKDEVTGETICSQDKTTDEKKDSKTVRAELHSECNKVRDSYVNEKKQEITKYYEQRAFPITNTLPKLWGSSKLKLSKVKEELEVKQRKTNKSGRKGNFLDR